MTRMAQPGAQLVAQLPPAGVEQFQAALLQGRGDVVVVDAGRGQLAEHLPVAPATWSRATRLARFPLVSRPRLRSSSQIETPRPLRSASGSAMIIILSGATHRGCTIAQCGTP